MPSLFHIAKKKAEKCCYGTKKLEKLNGTHTNTAGFFVNFNLCKERSLLPIAKVLLQREII